MIRSLCLLFIILLAGLCFAGNPSTSTRVKNLTAFTRLWGYVKHFYPSDEAQEIDWDSFAVYGSQYVIKARDNDELSRSLSELFQPIVPELVLYTHTKPETKTGDILPGRKTAFWQYEGYNNMRESSVYTSVRTNRPHKISKNPKNTYIWTSLTPQLPKDIGFGAKIKLSLKIRHADSDTLATDIMLGYGGDYAKEALNPADGSEKSFVLQGSEDQEEPLWLVLLNFEHLMLDYLRVEEWENEAWQPLFYSDFSKDKPGALPDNFNVCLSPLSSVMSGDVDVLVQNYEGKSSLSIQKSTSAESYTLGIVDKIFPEELPYGEMLDKPLIPGLNCYFPMVLQCDLAHTYPIAEPDKLQNLKQKYYAVDLHDRTAPGVWLAGVIRYWNELQFFYPYFEYNICDWEKELPMCLERVLKSRDFPEYKQGLLLLMSKTADGHAFLSDQSHNSRMPKFNTYPMDGKWIVSSVLDDSMGVGLSDEVVKMNGKNFAKLMRDNRPYFSLANPETTDIRLFSRYLKTYPDSVATFTFKDTNRHKYTRELPLEEYSGWKWVVSDDRIVHYDDGIVYLNANIITEAELQEAMPSLIEAKGIILDLRYYPSISYELLTHLLSEPDSLSNIIIKRYMRPQEELPRLNEGQLTWSLRPAEPHIKAKVIALSSRNSQSYCESYLANLQHNKLATIVGQPTAGANGNVIVSPLPGDIKVYWTGMLVRNPDNSRFFGVGIIPDVIVNKTMDDIRHGRDPEREKALEILRAR